MARLFRKRIENKGLAPGSLVFIGTQRMKSPHFQYFLYNKDRVETSDCLTVEDLPKSKRNRINWINLDGVHDANTIESLGKNFSIHPLALEDIMNTGQRAKLAEYDNSIFITLKMLSFDQKVFRIQSEQLSFVLLDHNLISIQEHSGDTFQPVRDRILNAKGKVRKLGADYLLYILLDTVVDNYIYLTEEIGEKIDDLEIQMVDKHSKKILDHIAVYKKELHYMSNIVRPVVSLLRDLKRNQSSLIAKETHHYIEDLHGLAEHALESLESYRIVLNDYLNAYHLDISTRTNEIMSVLTVFSAVFIPITFIAGVYGTNFDVLPELHHPYSYPIFWIVNILVASVMLLYFYKKKWL